MPALTVTAAVLEIAPPKVSAPAPFLVMENERVPPAGRARLAPDPCHAGQRRRLTLQLPDETGDRLDLAFEHLGHAEICEKHIATLVEHGGLSALNDVGVRALASRYGNPDVILRRDYIPAIPGVNTPGKYEDYARNPGAYWTQWANKINGGTYEYFKP